MEIFYTNSHGPDKKALKCAFIKSVQLSQSSGTGSCIFATHTKNNLKKGIYDNVLGKDFVKQLFKGPTKFNDCTFYLQTERTSTAFTQCAVIFSPHVSLKFLQDLINRQGIISIVYVPWTESELNSFLSLYNGSHEIKYTD